MISPSRFIPLIWPLTLFAVGAAFSAFLSWLGFGLQGKILTVLGVYVAAVFVYSWTTAWLDDVEEAYRNAEDYGDTTGYGERR